MTEEKSKHNYCNKDGVCEVQCLEDQKACEFYVCAKTLFPGNCIYLMFRGNCQSPEALLAKWKAMKAAAKPAER